VRSILFFFLCGKSPLDIKDLFYNTLGSFVSCIPVPSPRTLLSIAHPHCSPETFHTILVRCSLVTSSPFLSVVLLETLAAHASAQSILRRGLSDVFLSELPFHLFLISTYHQFATLIPFSVISFSSSCLSSDGRPPLRPAPPSSCVDFR